jgi:hypothetical protein
LQRVLGKGRALGADLEAAAHEEERGEVTNNLEQEDPNARESDQAREHVIHTKEGAPDAREGGCAEQADAVQPDQEASNARNDVREPAGW